ncbi:Proton-dependent Oligopeptide Transporter (POT) Family [Thraustotheca clavata]|uniref:Proton-dependent Oligopeptide Transporter (POT) Family n=1 Tax=Thraustotheca clavata TaxID=74557 RepID=A0A1V9Z568_9STRA|nr:Proton-dependent Oligopeptide Transporter (POT) Family [Thraustotheca clavata]
MVDEKQSLKSPSVPYESIWDARPRKFSNVLIQVTGFILLMEVSERMSYFGINQGLKNFMQTVLGWSTVSANSIKSTWSSLCYISPLLGAYLADERWGRFKTIAIFGTLYFIGNVLLVISANPHVLNWKETSVDGYFDRVGANTKPAEGLFVFALFACIGIGTGAIKSNIITLGADQFNPNDEREAAQKITFFSYFYWCVNFGAAFSYGYLATLCVKGSAAITPDNGYFATFLICACVMAVALLTFFAGSSRYIKVPPNSDAMSKLVRVLFQASYSSWSARGACTGFVLLILSFILNLTAVFLTEGSSARQILTYAAGVMVILGCLAFIATGINSHEMAKAKRSNGGRVDDQSIDEIMKVVRVLPFASFLVMWYCVYDEIDANFQSVSQQTDLRFGNEWNATQLSGAVLGVFDPIAIVICIPVLDLAIYPFYKRITGKAASPFGKVLVGLLIATFTMFYIGGFEIIRKNSGVILLGNSTNPDDKIPVISQSGGQPMNAIKWGWNIPQFVFVALCECLINVTAYDIFYSEVPEYLKSTCQAINLFMVAMGANVASIFTLIFQSQIPNDINDGHMENMFFAVGATLVVNVIAYVIVMRYMQFGMVTEGENLNLGDELNDKQVEANRSSNLLNARDSFTQQRS